MGYATLQAPQKARRTNSVYLEKSASGDFFEEALKLSLENRRQPLKPRQKTEPTPTKTALGVLYEHYRYTAFGEAEIYNTQGQKLAESAIDNDVLWNSRRFDGDTGLYYYKYRHYAPELGRWLGRDPIEEDGGVNLYAFVGNDSLNEFDRLGQEVHPRVQKKACLSWFKNKSVDEGYGIVEVKKLQQKLKKKGCKIPKIYCKCCGPIMKGTGGYWNRRNGIYICEDNMAKNGVINDKNMKALIHHEYVHAWQTCQKMPGLEPPVDDITDPKKTTCKQSVCAEIQAYDKATCKGLKGEARLNCVKSGVRFSSKKFCGAADTDPMVEKQYESCKNWGK